MDRNQAAAERRKVVVNPAADKQADEEADFNKKQIDEVIAQRSLCIGNLLSIAETICGFCKLEIKPLPFLLRKSLSLIGKAFSFDNFLRVERIHTNHISTKSTTKQFCTKNVEVLMANKLA